MSSFAGPPAPKTKSVLLDGIERSLSEGRKCVLRGVELDEQFPVERKDQKIAACEWYKKGIDHFRDALGVQLMNIPNDRRKEACELQEKVRKNMRKAEERFITLTNTYLATKLSSSEPRPGTSTPSQTCAPAGRKPGAMVSSTKPRSAAELPRNRSVSDRPDRNAMLRGVDAKFGNLLLDDMLDKTGVTLNDVYGCDSAKQALEEAVIFPALNPSLFSGLRRPVKGILLFGPPGNGKTLLAKALATESNQTFFNISASALTSKWVGDAEKTVKALFQIARNAQPSIVFVDEIDSVLCERNEKESDGSRRLKTEFLIQFDGASTSDDDRILVIGATNRPHELDDAILRRFPKRILLGLPDAVARGAVIMHTLKKHNESLSEASIRHIAKMTDGYSNSDLVNLCREAAMVPVRKMGRDRLLTTNEHTIRSLQVSDFEEALQVIKPSTNPHQLELMKTFAARCGQA